MKRMDRNVSSRLGRGAGQLGVVTLISRVLGFVRDAVIAGLLGAGLYGDAFLLAFRIPNLVRKLFSDGVLSISFVPAYTSCLKGKGRDEAMAMVHSAFFWVSVLGVLVTFAGILFAPAFVSVVAPGFAQDPYQVSVTVMLTRIMVPYLLFLSITALSMGILNSLGHFLAPAAAPVALNATIIFFAVLVSPGFDIPAIGLALGVTAGGIIQLAIQLPVLWANGIYFLKFKLKKVFHPATIVAGKRLVPAMIGAAGFQINIIISSFLASNLTQGSISYLYYADRIVQFPMALFAVSVSIVLLPELSRHAAAGSDSDTAAVFAQGLRMVLFITFPAMAGLIALRTPLVSLLFFQGAFDLRAVYETASALLYFSFGLWAFSAVRVFVTLFYAHSDIRTPFWAGGCAIISNLLLSFIFMRFLGYQGLALSISIAAFVNFILLFGKAVPYLTPILWKEIGLCACRSVFISGMMGFFVGITASGLPVDGSAGKIGLLAGVIGCVLMGIVIYAGGYHLIGGPEFQFIRGIFIKGNRKKGDTNETGS